MIIIRKTKYEWGVLRVIEKGQDYRIVIHPEDWQAIEKVIKDLEGKIDFLDEQGIFWETRKEEDQLIFTAKGNKKLKIKINELI